MLRSVRIVARPCTDRFYVYPSGGKHHAGRHHDQDHDDAADDDSDGVGGGAGENRASDAEGWLG